MKNNETTNESYVKSNYKVGELTESVGGSKALSDFLDMVVHDEEIAKPKEYENIGLKIHQEICKS